MEFLWIEGNVNPVSYRSGAVPDDGVHAHPGREKPKVVIMATHLKKYGFTDPLPPQEPFFSRLISGPRLGCEPACINFRLKLN